MINMESVPGFMKDHIERILDHPDGSERVLLVRRADGRYTYRRQWRCGESGEWGRPGPDLGIYDSADTAETEARQRVAWLKAKFH